jgi:hypothetical protein
MSQVHPNPRSTLNERYDSCRRGAGRDRGSIRHHRRFRERIRRSIVPPPPPHRSNHPVFVQTDNLAGNQIVAYDQAANGSLTQAGTYNTGGLGGVLEGSVVDHLASQGSQRRRFEAHIASCPHCTEYIAQMRTTIRLTGRLQGENLTPEMEDDFAEIYRRWRSEESR